MAVTRDKEVIYNLMRRKEVTDWEIRDNYGKDMIDCLDHTEGKDVEQAISIMDGVLSNISGVVLIILRDWKNATNAGRTGKQPKLYKFDFQSSADSIHLAQRPVQGHSRSDLQDLIEAKLAAANADFTRQLELQKMQIQLDEAQKINPILDKVLGKLDTVLPVIINGFISRNKVSVNGINDQPIQSEHLRITQAIRRLKKQDDKLAYHLEILASLSENSPEFFAATLNQLENLAQPEQQPEEEEFTYTETD